MKNNSQTNSTTTDLTKKRNRILAIDLIRIFVIALVISTHIMASGPLYNSITSGLIWMESHTSRNLFILLSALVLVYTYNDGRPFKIGSFYLKRFMLVVLPYATWTLIYQLRYGINQHTIGDFVGVFFQNFITAGAMYHLYFLLITMQLYVFFPLIRYVYNKLKKYPWRILILSGALQLLITTVMQYAGNTWGLSWWLNNPDNYILSYQFYIVAGILVASHLQVFEQFVARHRKTIFISTGVTTAIGILFYYAQLGLGLEPNLAADVFQPYIVIESAVFGLALFALGTRWVQKGMHGKKIVDMIAQDSFGIYLSHVFILSYFVVLQPAGNDWVTAIVILIIGLPLVYIASFIGVEIIRHTPISVFITGRKYVPLVKFRRPSQPTPESSVM